MTVVNVPEGLLTYFGRGVPHAKIQLRGSHGKLQGHGDIALPLYIFLSLYIILAT